MDSAEGFITFPFI